jgi:hypothetical protein
MRQQLIAILIGGIALLGLATVPAAGRETSGRETSGHDDTYSPDEITQSVSDFFGMTTEASAKAVERVFSDLGEPDGYIKGDEGSGAFIAGVRYGSGWLVRARRSDSISAATPRNASRSSTICAKSVASISAFPASKAASTSSPDWV